MTGVHFSRQAAGISDRHGQVVHHEVEERPDARRGAERVAAAEREQDAPGVNASAHSRMRRKILS